MRPILLLVFFLVSCDSAPKPAAAPPAPAPRCTFVSSPIPPPSTNGPAEVSTLKDPNDPLYGALDMLKAGPLSPDKRDRLAALYLKAEAKVKQWQKDIDFKRGEYFRAVVRPARDTENAARLRQELTELSQKQMEARLNVLDQVIATTGYWEGLDLDYLQRAFLREERRRAQLEMMKCEF